MCPSGSMKAKDNELVCCSNHLYNSFALGEPFLVQEGRYEKVVAALVSFNVLCLVFVIVGIVLDWKKKLMFGQALVDDKFNVSKDGARAVDMDITNSAPSGKIPDKS